MTQLLHRIGLTATARPWRVLAAWLAVLTALVAVTGIAGGSLRDTMTAPDSSSGRALETLRADVPEVTGASAHFVARWDGAADADAVESARRRADAIDGVRETRVRISDDGSTALIAATFTDELPDVALAPATDALTAAGRPMADSGALVAVGGPIPEAIQGPDGTAELVGVGVALVVLIAAFGSVLAAGLPLLVALLGLGAGLCLIMVLAAFVDVSTVSPTLGMMMGLGVGIDYALLIVARHREGMARGRSPAAAAVDATVTAGRTVVAAGTVVLVAITGLLFAGVPGFATMGLAAALVVLACVAAAVTAAPAMLVLLGERMRGRPGRATFRSPLAVRVASRVVRRPAGWLAASVALLIVLALPALGMRLGQNDAGSEQAGSPTRVAFDLVAEAFGPGVNGPLTVVAPAGVTAETIDVLKADTGVADASPPMLSENGSTAVVTAVPATGPADEATFDLVERLHRTLPDGAEVTGSTAAMVDTTDVLREHLWRVVTAVLVATYLLLVLVMRSVFVPLKAVAANLLSVGAAYGVMTLAFQTELGAGLLGLPGPVPVPGWAPVVLFGILFGLSMDYEVFMVSRVREYHENGAEPARSVVEGLGATAKIITFAGAVMVAVAFGFALDPGVMVKIIGVGMAAAILVDVTVVRMVLVPAALALMGRVNWYLPAVLRRAEPAARAEDEARNPESDGIPAAWHHS